MHDGDGAMDAYAYMLECLRSQEFARLRTYQENGRAKFSTWLVVVLRRMALDQRRQRVGRERTGQATTTGQLRRRLERLAGEVLDVAHVVDVDGETADARVRRSELSAVLTQELSRLDSRDALLLTLRFEEDLSASHIAGVMGFPSQFHVYRRLRSVLRDLRERLQRRGIDDPAT